MGDQGRKAYTHKKGISLPLHRWKMLVDSFEVLDQALNEKREYATHLGGNVYANMKANGICMDLRQHWLPLPSNISRAYQEGNTVNTGRIRQIERCCQFYL